MSKKQVGIIVGGSLAVAIVAAITVAVLVATRIIINPLDVANVALVDQSTLDGLSKKSGSAADTTRIGAGIIPPTNSWISGMVLQKTPLPVYPMPLSFLAKDAGFEVGLPNVQSAPTVITGQHTPGITANVDGATGFSLTRYDKISASLTYSAASKRLAVVTLAEGSPFVFYRAISDSSLEVTNIGSVTKGASSSYLRYTKAGHEYVVHTQDGAKINVAGSTASIVSPKESLVTFYALPGNGSDTLQDFAGNELSFVAVTNAAGPDNTTQTRYEYKTSNAKATIFVPMAYSTVVPETAATVTYQSIYGPMNGITGSVFTTVAKTIVPSNQLDLSRLTDDHKKQLIESLSADSARTAITANDSYYAGKQLARAATLLDIAEQLGQTEASNRLKSILKDGFAQRLTGSYFYYDPTLKGIAAQTKAFGSEDFNDHHFHYGYFIYAASIYGKYDADFLKSSQKQVNLLVADIASYAASADFPLQRNYDPYAGHSWAAGLSPFADGNNQESSSEAVNAWNGVALWAKLTKNPQLASSASWMLANEAATAKAAWRTVDTSPSYLKDFTSPLTSLSFGGKRTYSTFFSDGATAKLGIQLLPMSPTMLQDSTDGASIANVTDASIHDDNYNVALGDYVLMYLALSQPQRAAQLLSQQKDTFIDDGNSRTYLNAWVYSLTDSPK